MQHFFNAASFSMSNSSLKKKAFEYDLKKNWTRGIQICIKLHLFFREIHNSFMKNEFCILPRPIALIFLGIQTRPSFFQTCTHPIARSSELICGSLRILYSNSSEIYRRSVHPVSRLNNKQFSFVVWSDVWWILRFEVEFAAFSWMHLHRLFAE